MSSFPFPVFSVSFELESLLGLGLGLRLADDLTSFGAFVFFPH